MPKNQDPTPRKGLLRATGGSTMNFMAEELVHDSEEDSLIRFRGMFQMPNWDGVEENEEDYLVDSPWARVDKIAAAYYDDPELKWVIVARNHLDLPSAQLYKGQVLKIPKKEWVETVLLPQSNFIEQD